MKVLKLKYKKAIASKLNSNPENIFLYWKGRVALYAILKAMSVSKDDEVILPAFTCVVVPNAIMYLGARPVYVDISDQTYNSDINEIKKAITNKTRVIICQNTFGLSSDIEQIIEIAKSNNLYTIEDCTHGFGGYYNGKPNGSYCDAAFYSTQWNKPFSTGIGGFLVVNNNSLLKQVQDQEKDKVVPSNNDQIILKSLILFQKYFINRFTYNLLVSFYRFLSKKNLIIGSTQGTEISDLKMPPDYFKDISSVQIKAGLRSLKNLDELNMLRKKNAGDYTNFLKMNVKKHVDEKYFNNHLFLKYPVLVSDRKLFFEKAKKKWLVFGDWFFSPIYPVKDNLKRWDYNQEKFPVAVGISERVLNLPTDIKDNSKVLEFLKDNIEFII